MLVAFGSIEVGPSALRFKSQSPSLPSPSAMPPAAAPGRPPYLRPLAIKGWFVCNVCSGPRFHQWPPSSSLPLSSQPTSVPSVVDALLAHQERRARATGAGGRSHAGAEVGAPVERPDGRHDAALRRLLGRAGVRVDLIHRRAAVVAGC